MEINLRIIAAILAAIVGLTCVIFGIRFHLKRDEMDIGIFFPYIGLVILAFGLFGLFVSACLAFPTSITFTW